VCVKHGPQLEQRGNQMLGSFDRRAVGLAGTRMPATENHYYDARSAQDALDRVDRAIEPAELTSGPPLQYSSPWPWVRALAIGATMWAGIGWLIWKLV